MKTLFINACGPREGDINVALALLEKLPREAGEVFAASIPRGSVYESLVQLQEAGKVACVVGMEMGGSEGSLASPQAPRVIKEARELFAFAQSVMRLVAYTRREKIDLICSIDRTVSAYVAALVARLTGKPFFLIAAFPFYGYSAVNRWVLRTAARILSHSDYLTNYLTPHLRHPERITTILDALDIPSYVPDQDGTAARVHLNLPQDAPLILLAGRINRYKGHDDLIRAARIVVAQRPDVRFVIVGREDEQPLLMDGITTTFKQHLARWIHEYGLEEHVILSGYVPDLKQVYAAANIVTMPSHEEPFGLVALEGMAMGKPVVTTRAGGVPEFVHDGKAGLLVPPRNPEALAAALLKLVNDKDLCLAMGQYGRRQAEKCHDSAEFSRRVAALMEETVQNSRAGNRSVASVA